MTNTLHRAGDAASFHDDYIVFAMCSRGKNDEDAVPRLRKFLEMARRFHPVNLGDARHGGAYRPSRSLNPLVHWKRHSAPDFDAVIAGLDTPTAAAAVFDNRAAAEDLLKAARAIDDRARHGGFAIMDLPKAADDIGRIQTKKDRIAFH